MGRIAFLLAAVISLFGAAMYFAAPWLGPEWSAFLQAPNKVMAPAQAGGLPAPAGTAAIGLLMLACAIYALAGAGLLRWLPCAQMVQGTVAAVCLLRGLLVLPYLYKFPERIWTFDAVASAIWFAAGLCFLVGILRAGRATAGTAVPPQGQASGA